MNEAISPRELKKAQAAHEVFLFNLIFNHVLMFMVMLSAPNRKVALLLVPILSVVLMGYTIWQEHRVRREGAPLFVRAHWRLALRRTIAFGAMWFVCVAAISMVYLASGSHPKPFHYALGALAFLPVMGTVLVLIIMESEALQHARHGVTPKNVAVDVQPESAVRQGAHLQPVQSGEGIGL